jgi:hypothetical protein
MNWISIDTQTDEDQTLTNEDIACFCFNNKFCINLPRIKPGESNKETFARTVPTFFIPKN